MPFQDLGPSSLQPAVVSPQRVLSSSLRRGEGAGLRTGGAGGLSEAGGGLAEGGCREEVAGGLGVFPLLLPSLRSQPGRLVHGAGPVAQGH